MNKRTAQKLILVLGLVIVATQSAPSQEAEKLANVKQKAEWKTNREKRSIELDELMSGGPGKDGIPAIDVPRFVSIADAANWLKKNEPVISLTIKGESRAYPLQILMWHEIVNDQIMGEPVSVTFCPLCYTAIAFDRRLADIVLDFGVSGMLRHSDMVMYDRQTESWWQQISGEGIVGDLTGKVLKKFPSQIVSFGQFTTAFPGGLVLSRVTGHIRRYGDNPYRGYDDLNKTPFLFRGKPDERLKPMEKIVVVEIGSTAKAYPHSITRDRRVVSDRVGTADIVLFHVDGAASALDNGLITNSKNIGSTGVFRPEIDGKRLTFVFEKGDFVDLQTKSRWSILGLATAGPLQGRQLTRIQSGDYFAFAWLVFKPATEIYRSNDAKNW